ncbi:hypothetical protein E5288_WYG006146 [Bos mutus]|uniref:Uncharacterized protein n=1 Tax=Bos mutus TaxID=72004 RepID=A0A6B0QRQ8_9CETA|nr:hypothetical protein [Bos mutus]
MDDKTQRRCYWQHDGSESSWLLCRAYFWFLDLEDAHGFEGSAECALAYERLTSATKQTTENESIHHETLLPGQVLELIFNQQEPEGWGKDEGDRASGEVNALHIPTTWKRVVSPGKQAGCCNNISFKRTLSLEAGLTQHDIEDCWLIFAFPPALCSPEVSLEDEGLMTQLCQVRPLRAAVSQSWKQLCSLMDLCLCL